MAETVVITTDNDDSSNGPDASVIADEIGEAIEEAAEHETIVDMAREQGAVSVTLEVIASQVSELASRVDNLESNARVNNDLVDEALKTADQAVEIAVEVASEPEPEPVIIEEPPEEDKAPGKTHWLKRPWNEWMGKE